jgi:hypothetical protein
MSVKERRMSEIIGRWAISEGEKKKRAQRMSYNERSEEDWYLATPPKNRAALERACFTGCRGFQDLIVLRRVIHGARRRVIKNPPRGHCG